MKLFRWLRLMPFIMVFCMVTGAVQAAPGDAAPSESAESAPYATLADILENEQSRNQLIGELRRIAQGEAPTPEQAGDQSGANADATAPAESGMTVSLPRQIADVTQEFAEGLAGKVTAAIATVQALGNGASSSPGFDSDAFIDTLIGLALVVVATVAAFFILRKLITPLFAKFDGWVYSEDGATTLLRRCLAVIGALILDVVAILLACVIGYAVGLFGAGNTGSIGTYQSLFINAFALVEAIKALIRMVFATRYQHLRLFAMPDDVASYWNRWLARIVGIIGYGMMVVVPVLNATLSTALGQLVGLLIMVGTYIYAVRVILKNRTSIRDRLHERAAQSSAGFFGVLIRILAKTWHLIAIAYFTILLVVSQVEPDQALPYMVRATVQSLVAIAVGLLVSSAITQLLEKKLHLSADLNRRLPLLEKRLNSYIPAALKTIRALLLIAVALVVLDAWQAFDLTGWLTSESGKHIIAMIVHVAIILFFSALIWTVSASIIEHRLSPDTGRGAPSAREKTLLSLFRNALIIVISTLTIMIVLSQIGINIGPLIAGAGVLGLAIGFGAQKLVQDIITGVFIQLENAMNTGDVVGVAGITGTAEKLTIRSVGIRDLSGTYHVIPFSSVDTVSNYMRDFAYHVGEYGISYRENVDDAIEHLHAAFEELKQDPVAGEGILEDMTVPGVTALADSSVNIRIMIKTKPGSQWATGRAFNRLVKKHFDAAGIEIPFPHLTMYFGEDKNGNAPPANIRMLHAREVIEGETSTPDQSATADNDKLSDQTPAHEPGKTLTGRNTMPDHDNDEGDSEGVER
ncbi:mechanosensitive channel protein [Phytohalomonas tamaricis]|uniref:mechanosensitive channel protein n=1 Tax=Phytohalomonas tamaricis TaxID=2081032 RepID=UPI0021D435FE|nr:mechanosensitive channel protein [Phytohalomonas tamaricis]